MKNKKNFQLALMAIIGLVLIISCKKNTPDPSSLYIPTSSDVTATATLAELQDGRVLYIDNCGACHGYYLPESYTPSRWRSIMPSMSPNTSMSASEVGLVTKYVCKGR
jgi:hypothetical protein